MRNNIFFQILLGRSISVTMPSIIYNVRNATY